MPEFDLKRTLDSAIEKLGEMHHATVGELQKANEAEAQDYVEFLEAQVESIAQITTFVESAMKGKELPFV
jgi:hypothetical protein